MDLIFVPTVVTALIYYIQIYICENSVLTQAITYSPQYWTLILPIIYLILSIKKKRKLGIIVNSLLVLFCLSAFLFIIPLTHNLSIKDKTVSLVKDSPKEYISVLFDRQLNHFDVSHNTNVKTDQIFVSPNPISKKYFENSNTINIDKRVKATKYHTENFDIYYIECTTPYFSPKKDLAKNIYEYVNKNSKSAIIFGDLGFPKRGLNYEFISQKYNDCSKLYAHSLLQTKYILTTKDLTPYFYSNFHRATDGDEFRIKIK